MSERTFLIVGASLAGAKAAEELRARGFDGRVVLLGSETERPYERPPLTKDYLREESPREKTYVHEDGFYADRGIELETGTTVAAGLGGIHYLRTLADCDILRERLHGGRVGSAASSQPLRASAASTSRSSIRSRCPASGSSAPRSAPSAATCTPSTVSSSRWANASRRSRVRRRSPACAPPPAGRSSARANALHEGPAAARAMLGEPVGYDRIPYFFSDQYDVGMEYSGHAAKWDEIVLRGDPDVGEFMEALIRGRQPADVKALRDPDTPLESLVGELTAGG